ncbi:kunitz/Bovine pancreatic trypsin inhibitor domain-containing protein [Ditylenchus destructor]|nr:kunitz/Bovine pancreatic trypsin inhibitor domain-containing protein [Ditylenchus destructor]
MRHTGFYFKLALFALCSFALSVAEEDSKQDKSACSSSRDKGDSSCGESGGLRFYYDSTTQHCQPFLYSGCGGNGNRFESAAKCREACSDVSPAPAPDQSGHGLVLPVPKCDGGVRAGIDSSGNVLSCDACPNGYSCANDRCCPSKDHACNLEYDTGKYATAGSHTPRYFYSKNVNNCLLFTYYGALGNANNFETYKECVNFCSTPKKE